MIYPCYRYCGLGPNDRRIVKNAAEDAALGEGWTEFPCPGAGIHSACKPVEKNPKELAAEKFLKDFGPEYEAKIGAEIEVKKPKKPYFQAPYERKLREELEAAGKTTEPLRK